MRVASAAIPQSTAVQPLPSRSSQRLMWTSAKGSGMRSQYTPEPTSRTVPPYGGSGDGEGSGAGPSGRLAPAGGCMRGLRGSIGRGGVPRTSWILLYVYVNCVAHGGLQIHNYRTCPGIRSDDAGDPLLRGPGPACTRPRRTQPGLRQPRQGSTQAYPAG